MHANHDAGPLSMHTAEKGTLLPLSKNGESLHEGYCTEEDETDLSSQNMSEKISHLLRNGSHGGDEREEEVGVA